MFSDSDGLDGVPGRLDGDVMAEGSTLPVTGGNRCGRILFCVCALPTWLNGLAIEGKRFGRVALDGDMMDGDTIPLLCGASVFVDEEAPPDGSETLMVDFTGELSGALVLLSGPTET